LDLGRHHSSDCPTYLDALHTSYTYDAENRLTQLQTGSTLIGSYAYDGAGDRYAKTAGGVTTAYTLDLASGLPQVLSETKGSAVTSYVYAGTPLELDQSGTTYWYLADTLGSVRLVTDTTGASPATYAYSAFGSTRSSTGTLANEVRFSGERTDSESGLEFLRARTYDAFSGTFLQRDSWGISPTDGQSLDAYAYTANNPANATDPSGHFAGDYDDERGLVVYSPTANEAAGFTTGSRRVMSSPKASSSPAQTPKTRCSMAGRAGQVCQLVTASEGSGATTDCGILGLGCTPLHNVINAVTDTLDVHTVGWCGNASLFIGYNGLGFGGSVQGCVAITDSGQIGTTGSGGFGFGAAGKDGKGNKFAATPGRSTGPLISNGRHIEDQQQGFNAGSLTVGGVEVDSEWGPSACRDSAGTQISTQYVGISTPGVSVWQGQSDTPLWWTPTPDKNC
jgi:RHS repeat-associated protein